MSRPRTRLAVTLLAVSSLLAIPPHAAYAAERWAERTVSAGAAERSALDISGDRLVWVETTAVAAPYQAGGVVVTWKAGDVAPTRLSDAPVTFGSAPRVSGDRVAWTGSWAFLFDPVRHVDATAYAWTPAAGRSAVGAGAVQDADVDGEEVVWRLDRDTTAHGLHPYSVFAWTPGCPPVELARDYCGPPRVSGGRVAFWQGDAASGAVYVSTAAGPPAKVTSDIPVAGDWANYGFAVRISGGRVVWKARGPAGDDVFTWTAAGGTVRLTADGGTKSLPEVSGDRVVWARARTGVYTWTPRGGVRRLRGSWGVSGGPRVSGDRVVWAAGAVGRRQVFTWTPALRAPQRVSRGIGDHLDPVVSGSRIAWRSHSRSGWRIVTATPVARR